MALHICDWNTIIEILKLYIFVHAYTAYVHVLRGYLSIIVQRLRTNAEGILKYMSAPSVLLKLNFDKAQPSVNGIILNECKHKTLSCPQGFCGTVGKTRLFGSPRSSRFCAVFGWRVTKPGHGWTFFLFHLLIITAAYANDWKLCMRKQIKTVIRIIPIII